MNLKLTGKLTVLLLSLSLFLCSCGTKPTEKSDATGISTATLSAVGDIFLTEDMLRDARTLSGTYDFMPLFQHIVMETAKADLTIGNLEGTFANTDKDSYPDSLAADLARCGFDILQTANSYSVFQGLSGLIRTKSVIEDQGLHALGTFRTQEERDDQKVLVKGGFEKVVTAKRLYCVVVNPYPRAHAVFAANTAHHFKVAALYLR